MATIIKRITIKRSCQMKKSKVLKSGDFSEGAFHTWHLLG